LTDQQSSLVKELEPSVLRCVKDQNGNHVVQKAIERVPMKHIQFIIDSFTNKVGELAIHSYGCRVIQRVLEHCDERSKRSVLAELHACGSTLFSDQYGNYVTQHIIEYGFPEDRAWVIGLITMNLLVFSKHKFASNVVERCLVFGTAEQRRGIMLEIIKKTDRESTLIQLIKDGYGNYVIRKSSHSILLAQPNLYAPEKLLDTLQGDDYNTFVEHLQPELVKAKRTIAGKQVQAVSLSQQKSISNGADCTTRLRRRYIELKGLTRRP
jgi:mRNA-binding protein PUF3